MFNPTPEDSTNLTDGGQSNSPGSDFAADVVNFAGFMRFLAPATPAASTSHTTNLW